MPAHGSTIQVLPVDFFLLFTAATIIIGIALATLVVVMT
jgi:hypothetical protein